MPNPLNPDHERRRVARLRRLRMEAERRARLVAAYLEQQRTNAELSPVYLERVRWAARLRGGAP